jgi:hypothetical protein
MKPFFQDIAFSTFFALGSLGTWIFPQVMIA